jgi:hypothetical protein
MNERAKELLEQGLEKARNKYVSRKKREKIIKMHHWQKDADNAWVLRDYKTFFLYIVKDKQNQYNCSFSGAKMSVYSCNADVYKDLRSAKIALTSFIDAYDSELNPVASDQFIQIQK